MRLVLALTAALLALPAWSTDWTALTRDSPLADFDDEDRQQYLAAVQSLLDAPLPAAPVTFNNPRTGAGAELKLIGQPSIEGFSECRRVRTSVYSRKRTAQQRTWTACRDTDGRWLLARGK